MIGLIAAALIIAASPSNVDVSNAVASASVGDVVRIPSGEANWTNCIFVTNGITLIGAGVGQTVIYDWAPGGSPSTLQNLIFLGSVGKTNRVSGIEFRRGRTTTLAGGVIQSAVLTNNWQRVDHCKFSNVANRAVFFEWASIGLIDNNTFIDGSTSTYVQHLRWANGSDSGHKSMEQEVNWGGTDCVVIESNNFPMTSYDYVFDTHGGSRVAFRYNTITNGIVDSHGPDSQMRGLRQLEIYGNVFHATSSKAYAFEYRSGSGPVFSNTVTGSYTILGGIKCYRGFTETASFGGANGTNDLDVNEAGGPFASGTATGGSSLVMSNSSASWTPGQWVGYTLWNTTSNRFAGIGTNTDKTITFSQGIDGNMQFVNGDSYQIWKVNIALDSPGRGFCTNALIGMPPSPWAWPGQRVEPIYCWSNTFAGVLTGLSVGASGVPAQLDREVVNSPMPSYTPLGSHPWYAMTDKAIALTSIGADSVTITVSPSDLNGNADAVTDATRYYVLSDAVTLTAPTVAGKSFSEWRRDGVSYTNATTFTYSVDNNRTFAAVYANLASHALTGTITTSGGVTIR